MPPPLNAGDSIVTMDVEADFVSTAHLTITPLSINFPNAKPSDTASIQALETMHVTANFIIDTGSTATLTVKAGGDLASGNDTIPINRVSWTAAGDEGFVPGSKSSSTLAGSWDKSGNYEGTFSFFLANSWSYATGHYSQTVTYTLTAP